MSRRERAATSAPRWVRVVGDLVMWPIYIRPQHLQGN